MDQHVQVEISREEAIVLFDYLARVNDNGVLDTTFESQAEQIVLWNLQATFEKELSEPFSSDYNKIVMNAREALVGDANTAKQP